MINEFGTSKFNSHDIIACCLNDTRLDRTVKHAALSLSESRTPEPSPAPPVTSKQLLSPGSAWLSSTASRFEFLSPNTRTSLFTGSASGCGCKCWHCCESSFSHKNQLAVSQVRWEVRLRGDWQHTVTGLIRLFDQTALFGHFSIN